VSAREAFSLLLVAVALIATGLAWRFGPIGLIGTGVALAVLALFVIDVRERREAVAPPARRRREPVASRTSSTTRSSTSAASATHSVGW